MRLPGRTLAAQLVWPVVGLVLVAVLALVAFTTWQATRGALGTAAESRERIRAALERSRVPLTPAVVDALGDLTGSDLVVWNQGADAPAASTLAPDRLAAAEGRLRAARDGEVVVLDGGSYAVGLVRASGVRPERAILLTPVHSAAATMLAASWPVMAMAAATLALLVPLGLAATGGIARRIAAIERRVERFARGDFAAEEVAGPTDDEVGRLAAGVETMRGELEALRSRLVAGERERLLGQLAAGFAHELRNAVTGARLAIDLHRRRCPADAGAASRDESLAVACRQLDILEEEVRGLLALGKPPAAAAGPLDVDRLLEEVRDLTAPRCAHAGVRLDCGPPCGMSIVVRHEAVRAALVNLALNGIDAAGRGGSVRLSADLDGPCVLLAVDDSGPGPAESVRDSMQDPFVTTKPEGIGLGLAVARAVAEEHGGTLAWSRADGGTRFAISLPARTLERRQPGTRDRVIPSPA
jgi:signal transduction histidine kinase